jgi:hypothetical protein
VSKQQSTISKQKMDANTAAEMWWWPLAYNGDGDCDGGNGDFDGCGKPR